MAKSRKSGPSTLAPDDRPGFRPALLRYASLQIREKAVAEDLVQNTLVAALQSLTTFRGDAAPVTWLIGTLKRQIIDHYRRMTRTAMQTCWIACSPAAWSDPEASLQQEAFLAVLESCLKGLAGQSGRVFALREIMELEPEEICKALALTQSNHWVLMHRARLRLRQCVERGWINQPARVPERS